MAPQPFRPMPLLRLPEPFDHPDENMRGPYTQLGCGVFVNGTEITVVQNFR
jgi:hypothetical protein